MAQQALVIKPNLPFKLRGGLQKGQSIFITGRVLPSASRFSVNLKVSSESEDDIALHFNPRYDNGPAHIVFNTFEKGKWGSEEHVSDSPVLRDERFTLEIHVTEKAYKIRLNGKHIKDYEHRIQYTLVDTIAVVDAVEVDYIANQNYPKPWYKYLLNNGLESGKDITIYGIPNPDCTRIEINLRHRYGIAFTYLSLFEENAVVCNTFECASWGTEERSQGIPFAPGLFCKVKISWNEDQFNVFVNDQQTHTYKHRFTKLEDIDVLEIYGGLLLFSLEV